MRARPRKNERGVAMLIAIISIAVLTVLATEFAYNSRVDLQMATNARDELRAYYMARSGVQLSRLLLRFQRQIDRTPIPNLGGMLSALGGAQGAAPGGAAAPSTLSIQLWRMARVDCYLLQGMTPGGAAGLEGSLQAGGKFDFDESAPNGESGAKPPRSFGGFEGCFNATISDEEEKLNLNKLDAPALSSRPLVERAVDLFADKRFEFLYEREDANRVRVTAPDLPVALRDWIDEDEMQSSLNLANAGEPFARGFSDENSLYDRYAPRYKAKNARFDTLDELYRVHGVNDRFMAAFRDRLTVYPDVNSRLNVNTDDPVLLQMAILSVADPLRPDPRLRDPVFIDSLIQKIRAAKVFPLIGMSVTDFMAVVEAAGVPINATIRQNVQNNRAVGDKSTTFKIRSIGEAGSVQKTLTAVIRLDDGLGRLVYWREE